MLTMCGTVLILRATSNRKVETCNKLRRGSKWNFRFHRGPASWLAFEFKRPAQLAHPFSHIDQPQPSGSSASFGIKTDTIIRHHEANATVGLGQPNFNLLGLRMFRHIAERLLGDAVDAQCRPGR